MKVHHLQRVSTNAKTREVVEAPPEGAFIIKEGLLVVGDPESPSQGDEIVGFVCPVPEDERGNLNALRRWIDKLDTWDGNARLSGIDYRSRTFGFVAPQEARRRYGPRISSFNQAYPTAAAVLNMAAESAWRQLQTYAPEIAEEQLQLMADTPSNWRLGDSPWTSGIINDTSPLNYHKDQGNTSGSWSAMLTMRENVSGGYLHIPELDCYIACEDMTLAVFNGQSLMHGVTPLRPERPDAKRYTIVWYAKARFANTGASEEELKRAKASATTDAEARMVRDGESSEVDYIYQPNRKEIANAPLTFLCRAGTSDEKTLKEVIEGNGYQKPKKGFTIDPGDRWLDGGVNIGAFTCWAHRLGVNEVVGFEAEEANYIAAQANLDRNGVPFEIRHAAIMPDSHEGDSVTLFKCDEKGKEWRHSTQWERRKSTAVQVPAIRISDALDESGADCVKLDIEGAEIPMLCEQSFPFSRIRKLAFEWSFDVERKLSVLREVLDRVEAAYPNVVLSRKLDFSAETFDFFPPQVLVFAWRDRTTDSH
tara:strand:+ start:1915 stop:3522 length:1608 start_codon:yes stop_codon:yes gene_type:complete